jgi:membrane associated rhomboid family serine protease
MSELPPVAEIAAQSRDRARCLELRLVLDAAGIPNEAAYEGGWWLLLVRAEDLARARNELYAYRTENPPRSPAPLPSVPRYRGASAGVAAYGLMLLGVAVLAGRYAFGVDWFEVGRLQAGRVLAGDWWRPVTALTLHGDAGHLSANLVFGALFGALAGLAFGGGVAWLAILLGGTLGNALNAVVQPPSHAAIGASTAVFAALGLLVMHAIRFRHALPVTPLRRWSPVVGGVLLLAYTGTGGERTDVVAHLTGFLAGLALGAPATLLPGAWLVRRDVQSAAAALAVGLVVAGWARALGGG